MKLYLITDFIYNGVGTRCGGPLFGAPEIIFSYRLTKNEDKPDMHRGLLYQSPHILEIDAPESLSFVWVESFYINAHRKGSGCSLTEKGLSGDPNTDGIIYNKQIVYLED